ncbi:MAG TPA: hypothetical protein VMM85_03665 [Methylomirabilota bacterium]|nr:hypothetical protein [Methylomirabilota bacterium]
MTARAVVALVMSAALLGAPSSASATEPTVEDGRSRAAEVGPTTEPTVEVTDVVGDELLLLLVLTGLAGIASLALLGMAFILAMRRRVHRLEPEAEAAAILQRRTIRRARMRLPNDPIVDALGIDPKGQRRHRTPRLGSADRRSEDRPARPRRR